MFRNFSNLSRVLIRSCKTIKRMSSFNNNFQALHQFQAILRNDFFGELLFQKFARAHFLRPYSSDGTLPLNMLREKLNTVGAGYRCYAIRDMLFIHLCAAAARCQDLKWIGDWAQLIEQGWFYTRRWKKKWR